MFSDLIARPLQPNAFSDHPFAFMDSAEQNDLANIAAIDLIENGGRAARENWQKKQLTNLLRHAHAHSKFWRQRMPSRMISHGILPHLPIQTRQDIATQTKLEGALVQTNTGAPVASYASTGSTGTPVKVFCCPENGYYTGIRSLAQLFMDKLSIEENRVQIAPAVSFAKLDRRTSTERVSESWAGPLSKVFKSGTNRKMVHGYGDDAALIDELSKHPVGYLVSPSRYVEILLDQGGVELFKRLGVKLWFHLSDYRNPDIVNALRDIGIPSLSNYSAGETGPIAFECCKHQGYFHVAHTNAIVERDDTLTATFNGTSVGRLLVTHLHSYATPIIRYDIGDFAELAPTCLCGHDGPTISNIYGRGKHFLRHPDGRLLPFYLSTRVLQQVVAFKECRVIQKSVSALTVEIGGRESLSADEVEKLRNLIIKVTDPAFEVDIRSSQQIDWSGNPKRLFFSSLIA
jgi:phenylacetate-CoA ligase